jgi:hypothetical protein
MGVIMKKKAILEHKNYGQSYWFATDKDGTGSYIEYGR